MSWTLARSTDWSPIADAASPAADAVLADGWRASVASSGFSVASGRLAVAWPGGSTYLTNFLARPAAERATDQRIVVDVPAGFCDSGYCSPAVRYQTSSGASYFACFDGHAVVLFASTGSGVSGLINTSTSAAYNATHAYRIDLSATGVSPTTIVLAITDLTASAVVYSGSATDSTASLQLSGDCAMTVFGSVRISAISTYLRQSGYKLVGVGNSLMYGSTASNGAGTAGGTTMLAGAIALLGAGWSGINLGVSGKTALAMIADAAAQAAAQFDASKIACIAIFDDGINDLYNAGNGGVSADTVNARDVALHGIWRAAGFKTIPTTLTPASPTALVWPADYEPKRLAVSDYRRANWSTFADGIADLAGDPDMGPPGSEANATYFWPDRLHYQDAGYARWASYVAGAARLAIGATLAPPPSIVRAGSAYIADGARYVGTYAGAAVAAPGNVGTAATRGVLRTTAGSTIGA